MRGWKHFFACGWLAVGLVWAGPFFSLALSGAAEAAEYGESLLDIAPPEVMQGEPPFSEEEFIRYLADYEQAKRMSDVEADAFFTAQGWSGKRLIYITVKTALGFDAVHNDSNSSPLGVPRIMLPTPAEQAIIKNHIAEIAKIFVVEH